ncbi:TPA: ead/Ea22-like family protein [Klebsiella pneumoniae]
MTTDITELAQRARINAECGEHLSPAETMELVEALEKSEKTSEARREAIDITHKRAARERDRANAAEETLEKAQGMEAYWKTQCRGITDHCEELQARIAEPESRTVTVKPEDADGVREEGNQFLVVRHPGKVPVIKHPVGQLEDYLLQILKADPLATIDIVTHRYYGAGGQLVKDADEYLHEMGIKREAE